MVHIPSLKQIQSFVNRQRTSASKPFTDYELRTYFEGHSAGPRDPGQEVSTCVRGPKNLRVTWYFGVLHDTCIGLCRATSKQFSKGAVFKRT